MALNQLWRRYRNVLVVEWLQLDRQAKVLHTCLQTSVCTLVHTCACTRVGTRVCTHVPLYTSSCTCPCTCPYTCLDTCLYTTTPVKKMAGISEIPARWTCRRRRRDGADIEPVRRGVGAPRVPPPISGRCGHVDTHVFWPMQSWPI